MGALRDPAVDAAAHTEDCDRERWAGSDPAASLGHRATGTLAA